MMYATTETGASIEAAPERQGCCPACHASLIPKCGEIKVWHWSHYARPECDPWLEPEMRWHRGWKEPGTRARRSPRRPGVRSVGGSCALSRVPSRRRPRHECPAQGVPLEAALPQPGRSGAASPTGGSPTAGAQNAKLPLSVCRRWALAYRASPATVSVTNTATVTLGTEAGGRGDGNEHRGGKIEEDA
jgi:Competence protein CoiA-like family